MASQDGQKIFSLDCVPNDFALGDPDHLKSFEIDSLYNHWRRRQSKGMAPFIVLSSSPQHGSAEKTTERVSEKKREIGYYDVNSDDEDAKSQGDAVEDFEKEVGEEDSMKGVGEDNSEKEVGDKLQRPPKFGPPRGAGRKPRGAGSSAKNGQGPEPGNAVVGEVGLEGNLSFLKNEKLNFLQDDGSPKLPSSGNSKPEARKGAKPGKVRFFTNLFSVLILDWRWGTMGLPQCLRPINLQSRKVEKGPSLER